MNSFNNIKSITKRQLAGYFNSPVAYVFIVIFLVLSGALTFTLGGFGGHAGRELLGGRQLRK